MHRLSADTARTYCVGVVYTCSTVQQYIFVCTCFRQFEAFVSRYSAGLCWRWPDVWRRGETALGSGYVRRSRLGDSGNRVVHKPAPGPANRRRCCCQSQFWRNRSLLDGERTVSFGWDQANVSCVRALFVLVHEDGIHELICICVLIHVSNSQMTVVWINTSVKTKPQV